MKLLGPLHLAYVPRSDYGYTREHTFTLVRPEVFGVLSGLEFVMPGVPDNLTAGALDSLTTVVPFPIQ